MSAIDNGIGIGGIGVVGPGMANWRTAKSILVSGGNFDVAAPVPVEAPAWLPANERRRATPFVRMVLQSCQDAVSMRAIEPEALHSVFASSCGDLGTVDKIMRTLTLPEKPVSPTMFHNSVHNAPAGYWSIGGGATRSSVSLSAHDSSFGAGLLEAVSHLRAGLGPVLLSVCDYTPPPAYRAFRPYLAPFAVSLILICESAEWSMRVEVEETDTFSTLPDPDLEALRTGNPAAFSLPLLAALAANENGEVRIPYLDNLGLVIAVESNAVG